ncbi:DsbA family protein [Vibrio atypicus]|uniref:DsbA family protein n=1 Tax=Vibrio atypicus TaxID=558271 RepID=UPI003736EDB2
MKKLLSLAIVGAFLTGCTATSSNKEIDELKLRLTELETNQRIIATNANMSGLAAMPAEIQFGDGIALGNPNAPIAMIEFTDLQCPYCAKFQEETFPEFKKQYIDSGKVYYVAKELPLSSIHPQATNAAIALRCTAEQSMEKYEPVKNELFSVGRNLTENSYKEVATKFKLDTEQFFTCMASDYQRNEVASSYKYAMSLGLRSTPSFIFGKNTGESITDYKVVKGSLTLEEIDKATSIVSGQ